MSFPVNRRFLRESNLKIVLSLLIVLSMVTIRPDTLRGEEPEIPLTPPLALKSGALPSNHALLVYPDEVPVGYATSSSQKTAATPISRRYVDTPAPEDIPNTPMILPVSGPGEDGRAVPAGGRASIPKLKQASMPRESMVVDPIISSATPSPPQKAAEIDPYHPPVKTASFLNVVPGETGLRDVIRFWGEPLKRTTIGDQIVHLYSTEILNHIEVFYRENIVRSIVVRLDEPFPEEQVREVLKTELLKSKPVLIPDEQGRIIGEVFPEKGVLFLFTESENDQVHLVRQIGIEPVSSEPFVLRAEATLNDQPHEAKRDLHDAARVDPQDAKAYWLLAQIELMEGHVDAAMLHCEKAIQLDERRPAYHLTLALTLIRMNRIEEAKQYLEETLGICDRLPHEKTRALCMLGDLYRTGLEPDYETAIDYHSDAIRLATTLIDNSNPTIRQTAKDVLFESHLGAARDIAWGRWDEKEESIRKWVAQAVEISNDPEMISAKRFSKEYPFKIAICTLACQVGLPEEKEIEPQIRDVIHAGELLIQSTDDPILVQKYQWETSLSLYDAVQIYQLRKRYSQALKYGEMAADYMESGIRGRRSDTDLYLLGRLYFRLGAIHAIGNKNHRAAIEWFDRAKPVFEKLLPKINPEELGRLGETLVSMGVSYWSTGQREEAVRLTERGLKQIERGVKIGVVAPAAFAIPYANLSNMYRELGEMEHARRYARLAATIK